LIFIQKENTTFRNYHKYTTAISFQNDFIAHPEGGCHRHRIRPLRFTQGNFLSQVRSSFAGASGFAFKVLWF